jgi:curved DNA-binding protein CbpA
LLKRAARKAKFFLHPDKLPNDLTEAQTTLFRSIWDVIQDSEAKTLAD